MSGLLNSSLNGSTSNLPDSTFRTSPSSLSGLSGVASPGFHHSGSLQGMQNIHGSFSIPNVPGALASRNSTMSGMPSAGMQQAAGGLTGGRYMSSNLTGALSQMSQGSSPGHSGRGGLNLVGSHGYSTSTNGIGGTIPGVLPASATSNNRSTIPGMGVSSMLNNTGQRIASSMGNMVGAGSVGRSISSGGVINIPGHVSRLSLSANSSTGSLNIAGSNRLMGGLQQASPQGISMLGNSYLPQNNFQNMNSLNSMGMLGDMNHNESSPFDMNDFPQLTSRPSSAGGHQQHLGSMRKQGIGVGQQHQEFSIQNEDFPALPGFKGGNTDYAMDLHQKDQLHDNNASMMSQHFPAGRSTGFSIGGTYSTHRAQQHPQSGIGSGVNFSQLNNQDLHLHGSDMFPSPQSNFHAQSNGLRPLNSSNTASGLGSYDHLIQQYQQQQNQSQYRLPQMSSSGQIYRDPSAKPVQASQSTPDPFGLLGLLSVVRMSDPGLTSLAIGVDLTTLGLNLNSAENLHKTFSSPWSDEPAKGDTEFSVPQCYYAKPPPPLHPSHFSKFPLETLFYIFYSMPKDEMQLYAANELYNQGWFYHREQRLWLTRVPNSESLVKTTTYERGPYLCFDPNTFDTIRKDNLVVHYEMVEKRPALPQH
ncbi:hypothetical protein QQ045_017212 [Rhodiola kirilowii]